jgi:thiol-disulfide isomerase/thioredoxin
VLLTLGRARADFKAHPKEVAVTVVGPGGKPVPDARTYYVMGWNDTPADTKNAKPPEWYFGQEFRAGSDGVTRRPYEEVSTLVQAYSPDRSLIGYARTSPFDLQSAAVTVKLAPAVRVAGTIENDDLKTAGQPVGWTNTTAYAGGIPVANFMTKRGRFEFPLPPGEYEIEVYGESLARKRFPLTVPAGEKEVALPPLKPPALALALLKGKPAPELADVVGWKGGAVRLADLKGKIVLLEFWGYWCGPCAHAMPTLFELHDKFKDQGLAIVGVHLDVDGDIDTAAKLDDKIAGIRKSLWKDRDLPFPVALCSGKPVDGVGGALRRGGAQYGIGGYPTTVLIGRDGKVVGKFVARDAQAAVEQMEKLLSEK